MNNSLKPKKIFYFVAMVFLTFVLTGCSIPGQKKKVEQAPVLLAQDCGMDGLKCCANEPKCTYGQACCVNPNNPSENMCADKCEFGKKEQFCDKNNKCEAGLSCQGGVCLNCGNENEACCLAKTGEKQCGGEQIGKEGNLVCESNKCVKCGLAGAPCCAQNKCFDPNSLLGGQVECQASRCVACGLNEQPTCQTGNKCALNNLANGGNCIICGQFNQPCCQDKTGKTFCDEKNQLVCQTGFCTTK